MRHLECSFCPTMVGVDAGFFVIGPNPLQDRAAYAMWCCSKCKEYLGAPVYVAPPPRKK